MLSIFVDTCVWRHWFSFLAGSKLPKRIHEHCENFDEIYQLVLNNHSRVQFLHNQLVEIELGESFANDFAKNVVPVSQMIPIPLTRCDGRYRFDGSTLRGGRMGGSLRSLLTLDGYQQDERVREAAETLTEGSELYDTQPRKREFDIEHMESTLEAKADLFLTNDEKTILQYLHRAAIKLDKNHPICLMHKIAKSPTTALPDIKEKLKNQGLEEQYPR